MGRASAPDLPTRSGGVAPNVEAVVGMVFDTGLGRTVGVFVDQASSALSPWEYDGAAWTRSVAVPPALGRLAFDAARGRTILRSFPFGSTFAFDGQQWTQLFPATSPPLDSGVVIFDPRRAAYVLIGLGSTWVFDGSEWRLSSNDPGLPFTASATRPAFDSLRRRAVLYEAGRTFEYDGDPQPAATRGFGHGCAGSAGVPAFEPLAGSLPLIGREFRGQLTQLPTGSLNVPLVVIGLSDAMWGSMPLPLELSPIGMPGCEAFVSAEDSFPLANLGGRAVWTLAVPALFELRGARLFAQGIVIDFAAPRATPLSTSNALELVIGD